MAAAALMQSPKLPRQPASAGRGAARRHITTTMDSSVFFTIALLQSASFVNGRPGRCGPAVPCVRRLRADQLDADALRIIELAVETGGPAVPEAVNLRGRFIAV